MNKDDLIVGRFYVGQGRFIGDIALWDGNYFLGFQNKFGGYFEVSAEFGETGFTPEKELVK